MRKFLGLLSFILLGFNFGYCTNLPTANWGGNNFINNAENSYYYQGDNITPGVNSVQFDIIDNDIIFVCFRSTSNNTYQFSLNNSTWYDPGNNWIDCIDTTVNKTFYAKARSSNSATLYAYYYYKMPFFKDFTSLQCQTEYSLIPIDSIDTLYCETNNLCPVNTGSVSSGENWSALYINNIQFPGKSNIFVTIPDYIYWDYSSDENDFNLYVGSGYDVEYIEKIIDINSYQPSSDDFTEIFVGGLTWIMPYIVIVLFIVFVWKLLKRIFR